MRTIDNFKFNPDTDIDEVKLYHMWKYESTDILYTTWLSTIGLCFDKIIDVKATVGMVYLLYAYRFDNAEDRLIFRLKYGI